MYESRNNTNTNHFENKRKTKLHELKDVKKRLIANINLSKDTVTVTIMVIIVNGNVFNLNNIV